MRLLTKQNLELLAHSYGESPTERCLDDQEGGYECETRGRKRKKRSGRV